MKDKIISNKKLINIIVILLVFFGAFSYAWLTLQKVADKKNILRAGTLSLILDDTSSDGILLEEAVPLSDDKGKTTQEYTFTLKNGGSAAAIYTIYLDDVALEEGETRIDDDKIKYILSRDDKILTDGSVYTFKFVQGNFTAKFDESTHKFISVVDGSGNSLDSLLTGLNHNISSNATSEEAYTVYKNMLGPSYDYTITREKGASILSTESNNSSIVIDSGLIEKNTTQGYELKVWIDSNAGNEVMGSIFSKKLRVVTEQVGTSDFATDSWSEVYSKAKSGRASSYRIGDTRLVDMGELGVHKLRVANTSYCSEQVSESACGLVLEFADIISEHNMNSTDTVEGGWPNTEMRTYLNTEIFSALPNELQNVISTTNVVSAYYPDGTPLYQSNDKLYLLSHVEIYDMEVTYDKPKGTKQLDYYKKIGVSHTNHIGATKQYNGVDKEWWMRTIDSVTGDYFYLVDHDGLWYGDNSETNAHGVSPAFRIG